MGETISAGRDSAALMSRVRGHNMAKAALENALWDAEAQQESLPLWKLLGGTRNEIACGVSIGIQDSHEQLLEKIETELAAGYQRIKVKVKPGWDLEVLSKIRHRWPKILLSCDANSAYRPSDLEHLRKFDEFNLLMIEQPLWDDDIYQHSKLQRELKTAICLDESIRQVRDAEMAIELRACRIINVKVGRVGGFSEALQFTISARDMTSRCGAGECWRPGSGERTMSRFRHCRISGCRGTFRRRQRYWAEDIVEPEIEVTSRGTIPVRDVVGTGYEVKTELIQKLTVREETIRG